MREDITSCSQMLYEWVQENGLEADPKRISKIYHEACRHWPELITRRISEIVVFTLQRMRENV